MSSGTHNIQKEIKGYVIVGTSLLFLTIVTVAVSYLHLSLTKAIILALIIATIKASLVACYFMHLIAERTFIYIILGMAVLFLSGLPILALYGEQDVIRGTKKQHAEARIPVHSTTSSTAVEAAQH